MSEMVERVARLLAHERDEADPAKNPSCCGDDGTHYPAGVARWTVHVDEAREIIAAMRAPTDAMTTAGAAAVFESERHIIEIWAVMIDEALK